MRGRRAIAGALGLLLGAAAWPMAGRAFAAVAEGEVVGNAELPALEGGTHPFLSARARANVFVFFRPQQDHSLEALKVMARCEREFEGKPVHWVAVVSSAWHPDEVRAAVRAAGIRMPVLVDADDELYGRLGVKLHPVVGVTDGGFRLLAYEPFRKVNYCDRIRGQLRFALGEIDRAALARAAEPARAAFPNEIPGAVQHRHVRMGEHWLEVGRPEEAAAEARKVLARDPGYAPAHELLGAALAAQGRCDDARAAWAQADRLDPRSAAGAPQRRRPCTPRR